jgi:hypothetical protein
VRTWGAAVLRPYDGQPKTPVSGVAKATRLQELLAQSLEQDGGNIAFPGIGQHGDDGFAFELRKFSHAHGDRRSGTAGNSGEDAFFACKTPRELNSFFVGDLLYPVHHAQVEIPGNESRADALNLVRARHHSLTSARLGNDRAGDRLHGDGGDLLPFCAFDVAADAGERTARADAADENVDAAVGVIPDLRTGGGFVTRGIRRIVELLRQSFLRDPE